MLALCASACSTTPPAPTAGTCVLISNPALECGVAAQGDASVNTGLVGYSCTGAARPDDDPSLIEGVPQGLVCSDRGVLDDNTQGFCCSSTTTPCAFNPVASCVGWSSRLGVTAYGYQCSGANRPDVFNSMLDCGQGVWEGDLIDYCCGRFDHPVNPNAGCITPYATCNFGLIPFICQNPSLPTEEDLGSNKSKSDTNPLLCSVPTPVDNPGFATYCCYIPAPVPVGGSCVQDTAVPGCVPEPGKFKFGFACYGPETPEADYPPMHCDAPGFPGTSAQGYPATLYCCEFE